MKQGKSSFWGRARLACWARLAVGMVLRQRAIESRQWKDDGCCTSDRDAIIGNHISHLDAMLCTNWQMHGKRCEWACVA